MAAHTDQPPESGAALLAIFAIAVVVATVVLLSRLIGPEDS